MFLRYIFFLFFFSNSLAIPIYNIKDVDFFQSTTGGNKIAANYLKKNLSRYELMQDIYEAKKPSIMHYYDKPLIPKVMHHVWDGDLPPLYQNYLDECKKIHPTWEFKIWTDKDIKDLKLSYQDVYDKARNYAGRSDVARYEILYRFGGVYRDMDVKCLRPIDDLNHMYDFFAPIDYPRVGWQMILNNGVIGAGPKHPILKTTLEVLRDKYDDFWREFDEGENDIDLFEAMVPQTSMLPLTEGFVAHSSINDKSIALPTTYFWAFAKVKYHTFWSGLKLRFFGINEELKSTFHELKPETLMHHNLLKEEIFTSSFRYGNGMYDPQIKKFFHDLQKADQRKIKVFHQVYSKNQPSKVGFNKKGKMPQIVHFVVLDENELKILEQNLENWQVLNANFEFKIWDQDTIKLEFKNFDFSTGDCLRFYIGLKILEKFGGTYADFRAKLHKPIFELNNKYNFYSGLMPLTNKNSKVYLSQKLIGASPNHPIISTTLEAIDLKNLEKINDILVQQVYQKIHLYDAISAKNIVLPAVYFEPFAKLETDSSWNKIYRSIWQTNRAFSQLTDFVVVE